MTLKLTINDQEIEVPEGVTVLQAVQQAGFEVPVFCYHPRLNIAGNCRMCLVEMDRSPKPVASCALPAANGMIIKTHSPMVVKARKGVLEFLLINHPLDCPICDQGGECDLQDITMAYGPSTSRFRENKRAVPPKPMGPLIKTFMNRCIHCTRCVRFATEIAGVREVGAIGRGEDMEITAYLDQAVTSELSGNMVDICPVGALTSKPYSFRGRPWDLVKTPSIDVLDAVGSNIRVDTYGQKVIRILPRLHEDINEEWISDKTRHACDGLARQRLDQPYVRVHGKLKPASWTEAFAAIHHQMKDLKGAEMAALAGDLADVEAMTVLKDLMTLKGSSHLDCRQDQTNLLFTHRSDYLFNSTIAGIEQADVCLIVDAAVRQEAPLIHARLRKKFLQGSFKVAYLGGDLPSERGFTFPVENLGSDPHLLESLEDGTHPFAAFLTAAQRPLIILGQSALRRPDGAALHGRLKKLLQGEERVSDTWNGFNVLHQAAARVGGLDIGFVPGDKGLNTAEILEACQQEKIKLVYLLGVDEIEAASFGKAFVIYQGHHGDQGAHRADVILPGAAYTEKDATYVNLEGRVQRTTQALFPPGQAKEDWRILRALADALDCPLSYNTLLEVRQHMAVTHPIFATLDQIVPAPLACNDVKDEKRDPMPFAPHAFRFYQTDPISRVSETMATCAADLGPLTDTLKEEGKP